MSKFVIYLPLKPYLAQWLTHSLGSPVRFPDGSNENAVIRRFLQKLPKDGMPDVAAPGLTAVYIPDSKTKDPATYNYLGSKGKEAVMCCVEDLFRINLWTELGAALVRDGGNGVNMQVEAWCEMHGIDDAYCETVRQKFYRMRDSYARNGIFLQKKRDKKQGRTGRI